MQRLQNTSPWTDGFSFIKAYKPLPSEEERHCVLLFRNVLYLVELKVHILLQGEAGMCTDKQSGTGAKICLLQAL